MRWECYRVCLTMELVTQEYRVRGLFYIHQPPWLALKNPPKKPHPKKPKNPP